MSCSHISLKFTGGVLFNRSEGVPCFSVFGGFRFLPIPNSTPNLTKHFFSHFLVWRKVQIVPGMPGQGMPSMLGMPGMVCLVWYSMVLYYFTSLRTGIDT